MSLKDAFSALQEIKTESARDLLDRYSHTKTSPLQRDSPLTGIESIDSKLEEIYYSKDLLKSPSSSKESSITKSETKQRAEIPSENNILETSFNLAEQSRFVEILGKDGSGKSALLYKICFNKATPRKLTCRIADLDLNSVFPRILNLSSEDPLSNTKLKNFFKEKKEMELYFGTDENPENVAFVDYNGKTNFSCIIRFARNIIRQKILTFIHGSKELCDIFSTIESNQAPLSNISLFNHSPQTNIAFQNLVFQIEKDNQFHINSFLNEFASRVFLYHPETVTSLIATLASLVEPNSNHKKPIDQNNALKSNRNFFSNSLCCQPSNNSEATAPDQSNSQASQFNLSASRQTHSIARKFENFSKGENLISILLIDDIGASFVFDKYESHFLNKKYPEYTVWYRSQVQLIETLKELGIFFKLIIFSNAPHIKPNRKFQRHFSISPSSKSEFLPHHSALISEHSVFNRSSSDINHVDQINIENSVLNKNMLYLKHTNLHFSEQISSSSTLSREYYSRHMIPLWKNYIDLTVILV
ncbi:hypothetical protein BB560_002399 [Smittium megazygosporum]|uniref:Uncharacterized protein n=1 Tax=Smittium megazygosporum TaxID=133381 RepID=A0A2T9ZEZ7_9FUNG|nr:hypothetical protein BB560_002399 [Smittium megazygosporum]